MVDASAQKHDVLFEFVHLRPPREVEAASATVGYIRDDSVVPVEGGSELQMARIFDDRPTPKIRPETTTSAMAANVSSRVIGIPRSNKGK